MCFKMASYTGKFVFNAMLIYYFNVIIELNRESNTYGIADAL